MEGVEGNHEQAFIASRIAFDILETHGALRASLKHWTIMDMFEIIETIVLSFCFIVLFLF